jgi:hypothetical protein
MKQLLRFCFACFVVVAMLVSCVSPTLAGDPAGDSKLRKFWSDVDRLYKEGPDSLYVNAFKSKYGLNDAKVAKLFRQQSKMPMVGSSNGGMHPMAAMAVCMAEIGSGIGAIIWEVRRVQELNCYGSVGARSAYEYCMSYSLHCPHYRWCRGCLDQGGCDKPCKKK